MRAARLDHRWELQKKVETVDPAGQPITTWETQATVWGSWEPLQGTEAWTAMQVVETSVARVRFRYRDAAALTALWRIEHTDLGQFEIVGEPQHMPRDGETVCTVSRRVEG